MIEPMQGGGRTMKSRGGDTIERILAAAEAEFARKGLQAGRVQDIARTAGVSKQIIYTYYGVKEGLYQAIIERITDRHEALFTDAKYDELDRTSDRSGSTSAARFRGRCRYRARTAGLPHSAAIAENAHTSSQLGGSPLATS